MEKQDSNITSSKGLYRFILGNKLLTICVLFTVFTLLDTIPILLGWWPAKSDLGPYVHLLGRFILHSILVLGLYLFDVLCKKVRSKIAVYFIVYIVTYGSLLSYLRINSIFIDLHPDAYIDASTSYTSMYLLLGIVISVTHFLKKKKQVSKKA